MTIYYVDSDGSGASSPYATWATAAQAWSTISAIISAGDTVYLQGAAKDTQASAYTLSPGGTIAAPTKWIGVKDGTTNEPPVASDLCTRAAADYYVIEATGSNRVIFGGTMFTHCHGIHFLATNMLDAQNDVGHLTLTDCKLEPGGTNDILFNNFQGKVILRNCHMDLTTGGAADIYVTTQHQGQLAEILGGESSWAASHLTALFRNPGPEVVGLDISGAPSGSAMISIAGVNISSQFKYCRMPTSWNRITGTTTASAGYVEFIGQQKNHIMQDGKSLH